MRQTETVRLEKHLAEAIRTYSYVMEVSVTDIAGQAVTEWLERRAPNIDQLQQAQKEMRGILQSHEKPTRRRSRA